MKQWRVISNRFFYEISAPLLSDSDKLPAPFMNSAAWASTVSGIGLLGLVALDIYRTMYLGYDWDKITGDDNLRLAAE